MKKSESKQLRLGLFVIISTVLFITVLYLIGQKQNMFKKSFTISANFQNVNGLQKGNNVRYSGVDIGMVNGINMINDSVINVRMKIDEKITGHIKKNAIATIGSDGLVGNMIINIIPGEGLEQNVISGDTIASYSRIGADDILSTLNATNDNLSILIAGLLKITNKMNEGEGTLGVLLNDTVMSQDIKKAIQNLKFTSQNASKSISELNNIIASVKDNDKTVLGKLINDTLSGDQISNTLINLESSSKEIKGVLDNINSLVDEIKTSEGGYNYLVKDTTLVYSIQSTMNNINEGTSKFNENMEALKHNFLFRGYFKKLERKVKRENKKMRD